jgi:hypothetical protein
VPGSEAVILELDNLSSATNHNGGAISIIGSKTGPTRVALRALGPSLQQFGIANPLPDPWLALYRCKWHAPSVG